MACDKAVKRLLGRIKELTFGQRCDKCIRYRICPLCGEDLEIAEKYMDHSIDLKCKGCGTKFTDGFQPYGFFFNHR